ncbi:glycosyltransferase family 4 protein [Comamonas badia]|uniref:glycosyltransferase family 4 protein n=1 Tax=Comamonas badia TaxID=265291 RepID=UPI0004635CA1|nr:glycosyltransferase family 4 protein [Comamonas badia]
MMSASPAIWFPAVRAGTGTDVFTERLVAGLQERGLRAGISWLPLRAEFAPWTVAIPKAPDWASICHVNTWLHPRFLPGHLPVVATLHHAVHDPVLLPYKGWLRGAYHRWWIAPRERRTMRRASQVVAVSHFVTDMARKTLCDVPIEVIHNGVDTEFFRPGRRQRPLQRPFQLLFVGGWMARKGVDLLAPVMRELGDGFELRYTGGAAAADDKSHMPSNMHDLGRLPASAVVSAMQEADAFLFPSRSEGLPQVVMEAMACGLPAIGMRGTSVEEVISDGVNGVLCAREDVAGIAQSIRDLAENPTKHENLGRAARDTVVASYDISTMLDAYINMYCGLPERHT